VYVNPIHQTYCEAPDALGFILGIPRAEVRGVTVCGPGPAVPVRVRGRPSRFGSVSTAPSTGPFATTFDPLATFFLCSKHCSEVPLRDAIVAEWIGPFVQLTEDAADPVLVGSVASD
jgi:hypothetical protein